MIDLWFEEELMPSEDNSEEIASRLVRLSNSESVNENTSHSRNLTCGILRVDRPRWGRLDEDVTLLKSGKNIAFYLVRLGFQLDFHRGIYENRVHFVTARCEAFLWSADNNLPQPIVYDVIPNNIYDGEPRKVTVKVGPEVKISEIGGSLGEVSTDFKIGYITPSIVGWTGEDERAPYWELRPITKELLGTQHLWLLVEFPQHRKGFRLATRVEADVQTFFGSIAVGPKDRIWSSRPSVLIF